MAAVISTTMRTTLSTTEPIFCAFAYGFTGKERDAESGLDYSHYRYYGSNMGRWMSPDPSGLTFANPLNPQSFNLYAYVNNNPLGFVDPTGLATDCGGGGDKSVVCLVTSFWDWLTKPKGSSSSNNGDTAPSSPPPNDPNFTPQLQPRSTPIQTAPVYQRTVAAAFPNGTPDAAGKQAYMNQMISDGSIIGLTFLHSRETIMGYSQLDSVRKMSTEQIMESLKPEGSQPMVVQPDGLIMNGNTRLFVLEERGVNIQSMNIPFLTHVPEPMGPEIAEPTAIEGQEGGPQ
jgi:RHS repeat-associated protein